MSNILAMKEPYEAAINGNCEAMIKFFDDDRNTFNILYPMTVAKDTAFHLAVHSKKEEPLKQLLERVENPMGDIVFITNAYKNTVLLVAALNHNIEAVKLLVECNYATQEQLVTRNRSGQTPLFKAASFGSTKVVMYLASEPNQMNLDNKQKLRDEHRTRNDRTSILHAAVRGEHFDCVSFTGNLNCRSGINEPMDCSTSIPTGDDNNDDANNIDDDVKVGDSRCMDSLGRLIIYDWLTVRKIWKEKRKRKYALELARKLIKKDDSWQKSYTKDTIELYRSDEQQTENPVIQESDDEQTEEPENIEVIIELDDDQEIREIPTIEEEEPIIKVETPLLAATKKGMIKIVEEILKEHPQAVEHVSHKKQNILHVAASYRQREVFKLVKKMQIPTSKLILGINEDSYTVLQHVADTKNYNGGTRPGPAYKLQEELEWFKSVKEIMPSFFTEHRDKNSRTAKEIFNKMHKDQLSDARRWIQETSQSCSAVAVLISTVVFAAAYAVPGGNNDKTGSPILGKDPIFLFFTTMDVISLSCSLTSIVMFLSILTSPFELKEFRVSLPRRLTIGFALLFMSIATTMLAFTSTIFLIVHAEKSHHLRLVALLCCTAFYPVSVLALLHFPLFSSFINASKYLLMVACEVFPFNLLLRCLAFLWNSACHLLSKKGN
ncbi:hypothetical protein LWI28_026821 [Acer negundo]|uniref:PGG domain-containing protein n=1 Tax=Acer negundo TaxID=4023 RepID=A0AAD5P4X4_ACENE|nr:hypothetical protein LWI28_026821 [Acer negundo]